MDCVCDLRRGPETGCLGYRHFSPPPGKDPTVLPLLELVAELTEDTPAGKSIHNQPTNLAKTY